MKLYLSKKRSISGMTLVESMVAVGIGAAILAGFTMASVALQKNLVAIEYYAKGQNDQMRISDYLSMDMRRAFNIYISGSAAAPPLTVTMTIPNFYPPSANGLTVPPYDPHISGVMGWPFKKHHHHKHQNIILNQVIDYGPWNGTAVTTPTKTVVYIFDNQAFKLYRCVDGAVPSINPQAPDPPGVTTIATNVSDFSVSLSDLDETAQTQIKFKPRFRSMAANPDFNTDASIVGTTYFQTTLTRNTR